MFGNGCGRWGEWVERGGERSRVPETPGAGLRGGNAWWGALPRPLPTWTQAPSPFILPRGCSALCVLHALVGRVDLTLLSLVVSMCWLDGLTCEWKSLHHPVFPACMSLYSHAQVCPPSFSERLLVAHGGAGYIVLLWPSSPTAGHDGAPFQARGVQWPTGCPFTVFDPWALAPSPQLLNADFVSFFFFFGHPLGLMGSYFPDQVLNLGSQQLKAQSPITGLPFPTIFFFFCIS